LTNWLHPSYKVTSSKWFYSFNLCQDALLTCSKSLITFIFSDIDWLVALGRSDSWMQLCWLTWYAG
jgi:hypothetical protein